MNREELTALLTAALAKVDGAVFAETLLAAGVPAGPVRNIEEALLHPQTKEREMVVEKDGYQGVASPIKFSRSPDIGVESLPPYLGEHTREVLRAAGVCDDEINSLIAAGTIYQADG